MRVCLIGASHYVDDDRLFHREAVGLSTKYEVEVVVAGPLEERMTNDGIRVTCYRKRSKAGHINLLVEMYLHLRSIKYDIIHCFDPDSLGVALLASRALPERPLIVYDAHEHFPSLMAGYLRLPKSLSAALQFLLDLIERVLAKSCDAFVVVNESLSKRFSVFCKPVVTVRNVPSLSWYDNAPNFDALGDVSDPIVMFVGNLDSKKGSTRALIEAKAILDRHGIRTSFVLVGNIKGMSLYPNLEDRGFRFTGWIDYLFLPNFLRRAKVGLALIQPANLNYIFAQPNKLFAYMVAGLPIVASDLPGIKAIVSREKCGILVSPSNAGEIAAAIARLLKEEELRTLMGKNGRKAAEREYNWEIEGEKLFDLYDRMLLPRSKTMRLR
jgi:glycosyltransferase involved in cell wall biosynthesis